MFIVILLLTSLGGINLEKSFFGEAPYFQGIIFYAYLYLFYMLIVTVKVPNINWTIALSASSVIVSFVAIWQWFQINLFHYPLITYAGRVISTFGQPNFYAGFLLLTLPHSYMLLKSPNRNLSYFGLIGGVISMIGIFVSYSRAAILLALLLMILALLGDLKIKFRFMLVLLVIFSLVLIGSLIISLKYSSGIVWKEWLHPINAQWLIDNSPEKRVFIWPIIGELILQKPWDGYGLENMSTGFSSFFTGINFNINSIPVYHTLKDLTVDRSHNFVLDLIFFSGIFGLLSWVLLVGVVVKKAKEEVNFALGNKIFLTGLITYLIWIQFQNQSMVHLMYFWLLVGLIDQA